MKYRSSCPVSTLLDIVGDKWSLILVRDLFMDRNTYSEFLKSPEKISTNILVDRLKKLVHHGIVSFHRDENDKKIKYYQLTSKGIDLYPVIIEMSLWSRKHLDMEFHPLAVKHYEALDEKGKDNLIDEVLSNAHAQLEVE